MQNNALIKFCTCTQINTTQTASDPRNFTLAFAKMFDKHGQKYAKCVCDTVNDHITHKRREHNDPAISAFGENEIRKEIEMCETKQKNQHYIRMP